MIKLFLSERCLVSALTQAESELRKEKIDNVPLELNKLGKPVANNNFGEFRHRLKLCNQVQ